MIPIAVIDPKAAGTAHALLYRVLCAESVIRLAAIIQQSDLITLGSSQNSMELGSFPGSFCDSYSCERHGLETHTL